MDMKKVIAEIEDALSGNLTKAGYVYKLSMNGLKDKALTDALTLLKEHEIRELTIDEWREWKNNPKRNPICELWEHDTSPMWVLNPDRIHEPALLMGKLKLFTGKPTLEQCKEVKWNDD